MPEPSSVQIPASLAAEVAAHPELFRPAFKPGARLFDLLRGAVFTADVAPRNARGAWALVGSGADPESPRPNSGRVLAVEVPHVSAAVGRVGTVVRNELMQWLAVDFGEIIARDDPSPSFPPSRWWPVKKWAVLPDPIETEESRLESALLAYDRVETIARLGDFGEGWHRDALGAAVDAVTGPLDAEIARLREAMALLAEDLLEARDKLPSFRDPRTDGRRYGLEQGASIVRLAARALVNGEANA